MSIIIWLAFIACAVLLLIGIRQKLPKGELLMMKLMVIITSFVLIGDLFF